MRRLFLVLLPFVLAACSDSSRSAPPQQVPEGTAVATFAGGCFWCMEPPFDAIDGVLSTTSGYTGGPEPNPTYDQVSLGMTGHVEAVQVRYDPKRVSYEKLLEVFWRNIDPTTNSGQFCDEGSPYRAMIFVHDEAQRAAAEASKAAVIRTKTFDDDVVTQIVPAGEFWRAEAYHQDFYLKNPLRYNYYRWGCGRDERLRQLWGGAAK